MTAIETSATMAGTRSSPAFTDCDDHTVCATHSASVVADSPDHITVDAQRRPVGDIDADPGPNGPHQPSVGVDPLLATIRTLGGILDDLERVRIMASNRVAAQEREYGTAVPHLDLVLDPLKAAEHQAHLELVRAWRLHPLASWAKAQKGIGEKSIARLISHTGDPADRPNVAKLWAYCGLGDPARKRRKGMTQEEAFALGNPAAKKQCWLIGEAIVKTRSGPYRAVYDAAREQYADRVHADACARCGPAGKPAPAGSPWSLKHQHEAAKRKAVKAFLKDLWIASRHGTPETHRSRAGCNNTESPPALVQPKPTCAAREATTANGANPC